MVRANVDMCERERVAREIEKTSEAIRKKHRALKTGQIEEDIALDRRLRPIVEPLRKIADSPGTRAIKDEPRETDARKREKHEEDEDEDEEEGEEEDTMIARPMKRQRDMSGTPVMMSPITASTPRVMKQQTTSALTPLATTSFDPSDDFQTTDDSLATGINDNDLQTTQGRQAMGPLGTLGAEYVWPVMIGQIGKHTDRVYGVRVVGDRLMLGNKEFKVDNEDNVMIGNVGYHGTRGLYELIFMKEPDVHEYTDDDLQKYNNILQMTNAYRKSYHEQGRIVGNRGSKYKMIIKPLVRSKSVVEKKTGKSGKSGKGLPRAMTLNDNAIDYVHWDDPNELVDRMRLLDASHRAGNNAHDNEILSILEELREAGIVIN